MKRTGAKIEDEATPAKVRRLDDSARRRVIRFNVILIAVSVLVIGGGIGYAALKMMLT